MIVVRCNNKDYNVPQSWNELTREQLLAIIEAIHIKQYDPDQLFIKLLKILFNFSYSKLFRLPIHFIEDYYYLAEFILSPSIEFTKQHIPEYQNLYGPSDDIGNVRAGEFVFADNYHNQWWDDKDNITLLNQFVAVIYRPAKKGYNHLLNPDGDPRNPFQENVSNYYAENILSHWPLNVKIAIAIWYAGCRLQLVTDNPEVFNGKGSGEEPKYGLISLFRTIAEKGTYGTFDQVSNLPISTLMIEMNETIAEGKKREDELNKVK